MSKIEFVTVDRKYAAEAAALAVSEYHEECQRCSQLIREDFSEKLYGIVEWLFQNKLGKIALLDGRVVGYLAFAGPWDGFFGKVKGAFSPLGGSAFAVKDRGKLASMLFEQAGGEMAEAGICSYALSRYAHDEEVGKSFVMNGFGIRCSDAIMHLPDRHIVESIDEELDFSVLSGAEKQQISALKLELTRHLASAPCFFPTDLKCFADWFDKEEIRVFTAKRKGKIIGYMALCDDGETFISESGSAANICGAYLDETERGLGAAPQLLEYLCRVCEAEGKEYLGVDCETINPTALHFWGKYFSNYTYSYARRIDERIVGYKEYLDEVAGRDGR